MLFRFRSPWKALCVGLSLTAMAPFARAESMPDLLGAVSTDALVVSQCKHSDEAQFITDYWNGIWDALLASKAWEPILDEIRRQAPPDQVADVEARIKAATEQIQSVDWADLTGREVVFGLTLDLGSVIAAAADMAQNKIDVFPPEAAHEAFSEVFLFRVDPARTAEHVAALGNLLKQLAPLHPMLSIVEAPEGEQPRVTLDAAGYFELTVTGIDDVVLFGVQHGLLAEAEALLKGTPERPSILTNFRFTDTIGRLPAAETQLAYADVAGILEESMTAVRGGLDLAASQQPGEAGEIAMARSIIERIAAQLFLVDRVGTTSRIENHASVTERISISADGWKDTLLGKALARQPQVDSFASFLPKEAVGFGVCAGLDPAPFYDDLVEFIAGLHPEARNGLGEVEQGFQQAVGLSFRDDILAPLTGQGVVVQMPGLTGNPMPVLLMKLKDEAHALETIVSLIGKLEALAKQAGQPIMRRPAMGELGEAEFVTFTHPMMMMGGISGIALGTIDSWLVLGMTEEATLKVVQTLQGKHANIQESTRFKEEGVVPEGPVFTIAWNDMSKQGAAMGQAFGMMGMMSGMIPANDPGSAPVRALFASMVRLAPVAFKFDFVLSKAIATTFDAEAGVWHSTTALNYRAPSAE